MSVPKRIIIVLLAILACAIIAKAESDIPLPGLPGYYVGIPGDDEPILLRLYDVDVKVEYRGGFPTTTDGFNEGKKPVALHIKNDTLFLIVYDTDPNMTRPKTFKLGKLSRHHSSGVWNMTQNIPLINSVIGDRYVFKAKVESGSRYVFYFNDMFQELGIVVKYDPDRRPRAFYLEVGEDPLQK
jgi:hypothetical protein